MLILVGGLCAAVLSLAALYLYLDPQVPKAETYRDVRLETPLRVYAQDGALIAEFGERRLIPIRLEQVPQHFINALLDTEDKRFYQHGGIDFISLTNDTLNLIGTLITEGELGPGASTITMQLARNVSFSLEQRFLRKFKEMLLALKIERELSKGEILELYINIVPFGKRAYGAEAAARTYYGKSLNELTLAQLAMLAGIPQAPSAGNPINGPLRALQRRNLVLSRMRAQGSISAEEYAAARAMPITARIFDRDLDLASPYPAEWVRRLAIDSYPDLYTGGYEIFTTINRDLQASAIAALRKGLLSYDRRHGYRGAEAQVDAEQMEVLLSELESGDDAMLTATASQILQGYANSGGLSAAVVIAANDDAASVVLQSGERIELLFEDATWARPFIEVDLRGPAPKVFTDILSVGDIVRVEQRGERWQLAQLPEIQGALISVDPSNGKVRAIVGGFDFFRNQYNHALQAARQPGSGFKPFVYSAALDAGVTPADIFMDAPLVFDDANLESQYRPDNDNNSYNGPTRLREALYRSINLVSMRVLLKVGAGRVLEHAANLGFNTSQFPRNTQLAIGGGTMAVTPLEMVRAYSIFANGGFLIEPNIIEVIKNSDGDEIFRGNHPLVCAECLLRQNQALDASEEPATLDQLLLLPPADEDFQLTELFDAAEPGAEAGTESDIEAVETSDAEPSEGLTADAPADQQTTETAQLDATDAAESDEPIKIELEPIYAERVLDERIAFIMSTMLREVIQRGTGIRARNLGRTDLAGKTGTTNEAADTWFNGFHPELVTTVWVGFSNHEPLGAREYGSNTPLPIWIDFMRDALPQLPERTLTQPRGVVSLKIDPDTGQLAAPGQANAMFEYFLSEHVPDARREEERPQIDAGDVNAIDLF